MIANFINCIINLSKIHTFILNNYVDGTTPTSINNLRKFHNLIKKDLILQSVSETKAECLLDIACGRGGDIHKWIMARLKCVYAFDSHHESVNEAISRFNEIKKNNRGKIPPRPHQGPFIKFKTLNSLNSNIIELVNQFDNNKVYDVVSCQFALHYFSENDNTLRNILTLVSKKLKKGGLFIGTASDGDLIKQNLDVGNVNIPLLNLSKTNNNNYSFYINENQSQSTINYFELQGVSSEYYLLKDKFKNIAEEAGIGLELVQFKSFYDWYNEIILKSKGSNKTIQLSPYEMIVSFLNFSFIFRKK